MPSSLCTAVRCVLPYIIGSEDIEGWCNGPAADSDKAEERRKEPSVRKASQQHRRISLHFRTRTRRIQQVHRQAHTPTETDKLTAAELFAVIGRLSERASERKRKATKTYGERQKECESAQIK